MCKKLSGGVEHPRAAPPLLYDPALEAYRETKGLVYDPALEAWLEVWPGAKNCIYKNGRFPQGGSFTYDLRDNTAPRWDVHNDTANGYLCVKCSSSEVPGSSSMLKFSDPIPAGANGVVEKMEFVGSGRPYNFWVFA